MSEQLVDLRGGLRILSRPRDRRLLAAGLVLGVVAGAGAGELRPAQVTSNALVLLAQAPTDASGNSTRDIDTQVRIVESTPVLAAASASLHSRLGVDDFRKRVSASSQTTDIVQVSTVARTRAESLRQTDAVARAYVSYLTNTATTASSGVINQLQAARASLTAQMRNVQQEIAAASGRLKHETATSAPGRTDAQLVGQLTAAQTNLSLQLQQLDTQTQEAKQQLGVAAGGQASILQSAVPQPPSQVTHLVTYGFLGGLGCLVIVAIAILVAVQRDKRLRTRAELADALGSPVLAAVKAMPQSSIPEWEALLSGYDPPTVDDWALRKLLRLLPVSEEYPHSLTVLSLSGDHAAAALGPQLAAFATRTGLATTLAALGDSAAEPMLWAACSPASPNAGLLHPKLRLRDAQLAADTREGLGIVLQIVDRDAPALAELPRTTSTVVAVSAGAATAEQLARLAVAADTANIAIAGVLVADPDAADRTTGRIPRSPAATVPHRPTRLWGFAQEASA